MLVIAMFLIFIFAYAGMPKGIQLVIFITNLFMADPIPFVDEIIMLGIMCNS